MRGTLSTFLRRHQKMHVVRHQDVAVNGAAIFGRRRRKPFAITFIIFVSEKDGFAIVAALDEVEWLISKKISSQPWHYSPPSQKVAEAQPADLQNSTLTLFFPDPIFFPPWSAGLVRAATPTAAHQELGSPPLRVPKELP